MRTRPKQAAEKVLPRLDLVLESRKFVREWPKNH